MTDTSTRLAAFFDMDRTLLEVNSGTLWVRDEWREGRMSWSDAARALLYLLRYRAGISSGMDEAYRWAARRLSGFSVEEVESITRAWFEARISDRVRPGAWQCLETHREAGHRIVLATSAPAHSAAAACEIFGIDDYIATEFEIRDGVFTGEIETMGLGDHKLSCAQNWASREGIDLSASWFYTDSVTDSALLEHVGHPVAVHPDGPLRRLARRNGWPVVNWDTRD